MFATLSQTETYNDEITSADDYKFLSLETLTLYTKNLARYTISYGDPRSTDMDMGPGCDTIWKHKDMLFLQDVGYRHIGDAIS